MNVRTWYTTKCAIITATDICLQTRTDYMFTNSVHI